MRYSRYFHALLCTFVIGLICQSHAQEPNSSKSVADSIPKIKAGQVSFELGSNEVEFTPGRLVAVVGEEHVLAGEVLSMLESNLDDKVLKNAPPEQIEAIRNQYFRPMLREVIKIKMLAQQYLTKMVGNKPVKDHAEARATIRMKVNQAFYEGYIPQMLAKYKASNEVELDQILRDKRTSLEGQKLTFMDSVLADEYMKGAVNADHIKIDILEVRDRYEQDKSKWERPARVRFQKMSVLFRKINDKAAAYEQIVSMFEEVRTGGAPVESVAKRRSQTPEAENGGYFDWTNQGALKSEPIDQAIFSIPLQRLSNIIEDSDGFHVVVVLEREDKHIVPFSGAEKDVREIIKKEKMSDAQKKLYEELQSKTQVFTIWPEDWPNAKPLSDYNGIVLKN